MLSAGRYTNVGIGLCFSASGQTGSESHRGYLLLFSLGIWNCNTNPLPSLCGQYLEVDIEAHPIVPHFDNFVAGGEQVPAILAERQGRTGQLVHRRHLRTKNNTSSIN